jgi:hypothetical protein
MQYGLFMYGPASSLNIKILFFLNTRPIRLAYQPPGSSTFLSEQISHQQPANRTNQPSATNKQ